MSYVLFFMIGTRRHEAAASLPAADDPSADLARGSRKVGFTREFDRIEGRRCEVDFGAYLSLSFTINVLISFDATKVHLLVKRDKPSYYAI